MTRTSLLTHLLFAALVGAASWHFATEHTQLQQFQAQEANQKTVAAYVSTKALGGK